MGKYSVPEEIRKMRPSGTMVKNIKGHFYVYEYSSTSVKTEMPDGTYGWKTQSSTGPCIGQITYEDGFIRNGSQMGDTEITVFEFGCYFLLRDYAADTMGLLKEHFDPREANQIFSVAAIFVAERFQYMKRISEIFSASVLSKWYPNVHVGKDALNTLYSNLGKYGTIPDRFQQSLIDNSSKKIAIDGHVIACSAESSDLSAFGYKAKKLETEQINWMTAYDLKSELCPLKSVLQNA